MRLKKPDKTKTERITFRCTKSEENKIKRKANIYTDGNISEYILYASINFIPSKEDFENEKGRK